MKSITLKFHIFVMSFIFMVLLIPCISTAVSHCDIDPNGTYIEAEHYTGTISQGTGKFSFQAAQGGYLGSGYLKSDGGSGDGICPPVHEGKEYEVNFPVTGTYTVWIRGYAIDYGSNSLFIGVDGTCVGSLREESKSNRWVWTKNIKNGTNTINISSPGIHIINVWVREANHYLDGIYITQKTEAPTDAHGIEVASMTVCKECRPGATQSCDTGLPGMCAAASQTCDAYGSWGACVQNVQESPEICDDNMDNDCDGDTDMDDRECVIVSNECPCFTTEDLNAILVDSNEFNVSCSEYKDADELKINLDVTHVPTNKLMLGVFLELQGFYPAYDGALCTDLDPDTVWPDGVNFYLNEEQFRLCRRELIESYLWTDCISRLVLP